MKFIGPRPALANQKDLNHLRTVYGTINFSWCYGMGTSKWTR